MVRKVKTKLSHSVHDMIFRNIHGSRLIYNACWEDPRIDRELLQLDSTSKIVMITSAGCNALDYLLDSPAEIHTVDVNPRQNALLQLKLAFIERGDFDDLFTMFGVGSHQEYRALYGAVRHRLSPYARSFWDKKIRYFDGDKIKRSFYYHSSSGDVAWLLRQYLMETKQTLRANVYSLLQAQSLDEQKEAYARMEVDLWNTFSCWVLKHPVALAMMGVPRPQIQLIARQYPGGVIGYVRDNVRHVFTEVEMRDNYFWRVYLTGSYNKTCCPNYLKRENLDLLRDNIHKIRAYTCTITDFLKRNPGTYDSFILLDHQDWLAWHDPAALQEEWNEILKNSRPGSKIIIRSSSDHLNFLPPSVTKAVRFCPEKTDTIHRQDRVGTYRSLHLAEVL